MKVYNLIITFFMVAFVTFMIGCKYDVVQSPWSQPYSPSATPTITQIVPAHATPGVNYITIHGTNFDGVLDTTVIHRVGGKDTTTVYAGVNFNNLSAEIVTASSTSITVRRPNLVTDSATVEVVPSKAYVVAKYWPYKIDAVKVPYGSFVANVQLSTVTTDHAGNLYVVETSKKNLWKITPDGQKTQVGGPTDTLTRAPSDAKISPRDGNLYYLNSIALHMKEVHMMNLTTGVDSLWYTLNPAKNVICGDFTANGWFYTGGQKSGIVVIRPDRSQRADGYYATDTISNMRVFNGYLYIQVRAAIYRHLLNDTNVVGTQEQVLDLTQGIFASRSVKTFSFSADGRYIYLGTSSPDPLLIVDLTTSNIDIMYKSILPSYCVQLCGSGNYLYMISGNATPAVNWTVYRVDMGTAVSAP